MSVSIPVGAVFMVYWLGYQLALALADDSIRRADRLCPVRNRITDRVLRPSHITNGSRVRERQRGREAERERKSGRVRCSTQWNHPYLRWLFHLWIFCVASGVPDLWPCVIDLILALMSLTHIDLNDNMECEASYLMSPHIQPNSTWSGRSHSS